MTLVNPKPPGYAYGEKLPSTHVNSVWSQLVFAVDGNAGGTYAPSGQIIIGGAGVQVDGPFIANGVSVLGNAIGDAVAVGGTAVFANPAQFQNGFTVDAGGATITAGGLAVTAGLTTLGAGLTVTGTLTANNAVNVSGLLTASAGLSVSSGASVSGAFTVSSGGASITGGLGVVGGALTAGAATFTGDVSLQNPTIFSGDGRLRLRTVTTPTLTDANETITPVTGDVYYMPTGTLSTNRQWTIDDTGCASGDWIIVVNHDTVNSIAVRDPSPATIVTIQRATGVASAALVMRIGSTWRVLFEGKF